MASISYTWFGIIAAGLIVLGSVLQFALYTKKKYPMWYIGLPAVVFIGVWCAVYWYVLRDSNMSQDDKSKEQYVFWGTVGLAGFLFLIIPLMAATRGN